MVTSLHLLGQKHGLNLAHNWGEILEEGQHGYLDEGSIVWIRVENGTSEEEGYILSPHTNYGRRQETRCFLDNLFTFQSNTPEYNAEK